MSAGSFVISKYQTNLSIIIPIRVQPETIEAAIGSVTNAPPTGALNDTIFAKVSGGLTLAQIRARRITIRFPATGQPTGYKALGITTIPALTRAFYNAAVAAGPGGAITYLGVATCTIVGGDPREARGLTLIPAPA
jgi:hypothetical protein